MVQLNSSGSTTNRIASITSPTNRISESRYAIDRPEFLNDTSQRTANVLANRLWSQLPIARHADTADRGIEHIIRIAIASSNQVSMWYQELSDFVPAIAKSAIEYRGDEVTDAFRTKLNEDLQRQMLEQIRYPLPNQSFVDFKFADLPPAEAWSEANRRLEQACLEFTNQVFAFFDTLQQNSLVGRIQETSSTCRFTFFRRVAILMTAPRHTEIRRRRDPTFQIPNHTIFLDETFQISDVEVQYRHAQCVHHVRNPTLSDPDATTYPLPDKYQRLIDCCPDWMAKSLKVLEGQLIREERIERDLNSENRLDEKVIERVRCCPAIVFGPYILAGWGEQAITEEENRQRDHATHIIYAKRTRRCNAFSILAAGLGIAVIPFTSSTITVTTSFAVALGVVAMALAARASHWTSVAQNRLSAGRVLVHSTFVGATVFAAEGLLFSVVHWSLPAFGMAAISIVIAIVAISAKRAYHEMDGLHVD